MLEKVSEGQGTAEVGKAYKASGGKVRVSKDGDWSESYMVNLFDWHLHEHERMPNLTGAAARIFKDFSTPLRLENPAANKSGGRRDPRRHPEGALHVFQSYWAARPMLHILDHSHRERWGKDGEAKEIRVYSNCPSVELLVHGTSASTKTGDMAAYQAAGLHWSVPVLKGMNTVRATSPVQGRGCRHVGWPHVGLRHHQRLSCSRSGNPSPRRGGRGRHRPQAHPAGRRCGPLVTRAHDHLQQCPLERRRPAGIIDGLHLIEVARAVKVLAAAGG